MELAFKMLRNKGWGVGGGEGEGAWVALDLFRCVRRGGGGENGEFGRYVIIEWPLITNVGGKPYREFNHQKL